MDRTADPRRAILEHIEAADGHPIAHEVFAEVNRRFPLTSRAAVYNTLSWLKQSGRVGLRPEYEPAPPLPLAFMWQAGDVDWAEIPELTPLRLEGRRVETYELTIHGVCAICRERAGSMEKKQKEKA